MCIKAARQRSRSVRDLEESRQSVAGVARRGQVVRPKLDKRNVEHRGLGCKVNEQEKLPIWLGALALQLATEDLFVKTSDCRLEPAALALMKGRLFVSKLTLARNTLTRFGFVLDPYTNSPFRSGGCLVTI